MRLIIFAILLALPAFFVAGELALLRLRPSRVQRLVEDIAKTSSNAIEEIAFIIGDFGKEVEDSLLKIAKSLNTNWFFFNINTNSFY